jgi:hypothetical protein
MRVVTIPTKAKGELVILNKTALEISRTRAEAIGQVARGYRVIFGADKKLDEISIEWEARLKRTYKDIGLTTKNLHEAELAVVNAELNIAGVDAQEGIIIIREEGDPQDLSRLLEDYKKGEGVSENSAPAEGQPQSNPRIAKTGPLRVLSASDQGDSQEVE